MLECREQVQLDVGVAVNDDTPVFGCVPTNVAHALTFADSIFHRHSFEVGMNVVAFSAGL